MRTLIAGVAIVVAIIALVLFVQNEPTSDPTITSTPEALAAPTATIGLIDDARINNADSEPGNWLAYGRTYEEQRFSPLTQINRETVGELGLAWARDMNTNRVQEATPIIVDGVMFLTSSWSRVFAIDAVSGEQLWFYDPQVPGEWGRRACCDVVNRGVAVYQGRVYVASLDGRLIALDAATGIKVWEVDTIIDRERFYSITGAPGQRKVKFSSEMAAPNLACGATSPRTMPRPGSKYGAFTRSREIPPFLSSIPKWKPLRTLGKAASGGKLVGAERFGIPLFMTPILTRSISVLVTARHGLA